MKPSPLLFAMLLFCSAPFVSAQNVPLTSLTGTWTLDTSQSKFEMAHPPIAGEVVIRYDGKTWHRWRSHTNASGKIDSHSVDMIVGSPKPLVTKDGPLTFYSRIYRDGDALVLNQDIVANDGQKAKNTVRYSLEDHGNTLIEFEHEETPDGNETNRWVSTRKK